MQNDRQSAGLPSRSPEDAALWFRAIAEAQPGLAWVSDDAGANLFISPGYCAFTGLGTEALLGEGWKTVVHADDLAATLDAWNGARVGAPAEAECRIRRHDGVWRWHLLRAMPWRPDGARGLLWVGTGTDVHDRVQIERDLKASEERFSVAAEAIEFGAYECDLLTGEISWSPYLYKLAGLPEGTRLTTELLNSLLMAEDLPVLVEAQSRAAGATEPLSHQIEFRLRRSDGDIRWVRDTGRTFAGVVGGESRAVRVIGAVQDITDLRRRADDLTENEARFRAMADNIDQLAWMAQPDGWIFWYNRRWREYTGQSLAEAQGDGWIAVHHPDHVDRVAAHFRAQLRKGEVWEDTFPLRGRNGEYRWFLSRAHPIRDRNGTITLWFGTNTDVTEQRRSDEARALLAREVDHRAKNALAVCQSIVRLSKAPDIKTLVQSVSGRIAAMARAQSLLSEERWEGGDLETLIRREVAAVASPDAVSVAGPPVALKPDGVQGFSLLVHELATNAAKYGALSSASGHVAVGWSLDEGILMLVWIETGGPRVRPPETLGFGSTMIRQIAERQFGGKVEKHWLPEGLHATLAFPAQSVVSSGPRSAASRLALAKAMGTGSQRRGRVLLVEDMSLIALDVAETLAADGWTVAGPMRTVGEALAAIAASDDLDCAVLDFDLDGEPATPVAEALAARGIPFLWCSGFEATAEPAFAGRPHIQKPIDHGKLLIALASLMG